MCSSFAFSFIARTKSSSVPLTSSASATAASLALATIVAFTISSTLMVSPGSSQISEPPMDAAWAEAVTVSSHCIFPLSSASMTKISVITLVIEAQALTSWEFFSNSTVPVSASIRTAAGAESSSGAIAPTGLTGKVTITNTTDSISESIFKKFIPHLPSVLSNYMLEGAVYIIS